VERPSVASTRYTLVARPACTTGRMKNDMKTKDEIINLLQENDLSAIKRLIDENKKSIQRTLNARKGLVFWNALYRGMSLEMARLLITGGLVDVHMIDYKGFNCLAHCKSLEMAQLFIEAGADVHHQNSKNQNINYYLIGQIESQELLQFYNALLQHNILPERILPDEKAFWEIVNRAIKKGLDDERRIAVEAVRLLQEKTVTEIIRFELTYQRIRARCSTPEIWAIIFHLQGGCSDDDFLFNQRPWMISLGERAFQDIIRSPEVIRKYWSKNRKRFVNYSNIRCDSLDMAGATAYTRRTGEDNFLTIVQQYSEPTSETNTFNTQLFHRLTNEQDKEFFYQTFPSLRENIPH
jgi:hypothetical protein